MFNNGLMRKDVAIEIIAEMIGDCLLALENEKDENKINEINKKCNLYEKQRDEIYMGNKDTIKYVVDVYGEKLKQER